LARASLQGLRGFAVDLRVCVSAERRAHAFRAGFVSVYTDAPQAAPGAIMKTWQRTVLSCLAALGIICAACYRWDDGAQAQPASDLRYAGNGDLLLPENFHMWIFVGSNLGLAYRDELPANTALEKSRKDLPQYHNIYINPEAYSVYSQTHAFPDKTVLVMDVYAAEMREPQSVVTQGSFNGARIGVEVAVKNNHRPDGKKTDWAYYDFTDRRNPGKLLMQAQAFPDAACYSCHKAHAGDDNVWVQFYPTLRRIKSGE
jgi:hypothetical protein